MIDWDRVRELHDELGDDAFADVIDLFCAEVQEGLEQLQHVTTAPDRAAAFHFLKGAALNLGMVEIAQQCSTAEQDANSGADTTFDVQEILQSFPVALEQLQQGWIAHIG